MRPLILNSLCGFAEERILIIFNLIFEDVSFPNFDDF